MARLFNVYKKDGTKILTEVTSPATITGLAVNTEYTTGDYQVTAIDGDAPESTKIDIPAFKTAPYDTVATISATLGTLRFNNVGDTQQTTAIVMPSTANQTVVFSTDYPEYFKIEQTGSTAIVTLLKDNTVPELMENLDIKITSEDGLVSKVIQCFHTV